MRLLASACAEKLSALAKELGDEVPSVGVATADDFVKVIEVPCLPDQDDEACREGWERTWAKNLRPGEKVTSVTLRDGRVSMEVVAPPRAGEVGHMLAPVTAFDTANLDRVEAALEASGLEVLSRRDEYDLNVIALRMFCR